MNKSISIVHIKGPNKIEFVRKHWLVFRLPCDLTHINASIDVQPIHLPSKDQQNYLTKKNTKKKWISFLLLSLNQGIHTWSIRISLFWVWKQYFICICVSYTSYIIHIFYYGRFNKGIKIKTKHISMV